MRVPNSEPTVHPASSRVVRAMERELVRLRRDIAVRDAKLRALGEAYNNLEQMCIRHGIIEYLPGLK